MRKYNRNTYQKFANVNKRVRESSVAPSAFSKIEDKGIAGKVASSIGDDLIATPLHKTTRKAVGLIYDRQRHKPYVGSVLYTVFKWGLLLILAAYPPLLILFIVTGALGKLKKIF